MAIKERLQAGSRSSTFTSPSANSQVNGAAQFPSQSNSGVSRSALIRRRVGRYRGLIVNQFDNELECRARELLVYLDTELEVEESLPFACY